MDWDHADRDIGLRRAITYKCYIDDRAAEAFFGPQSGVVELLFGVAPRTVRQEVGVLRRFVERLV